MSETIFRGLFDAETASVIAVSDFMACIVSALVIGLILAVMHMYKNRSEEHTSELQSQR